MEWIRRLFRFCLFDILISYILKLINTYLGLVWVWLDLVLEIGFCGSGQRIQQKEHGSCCWLYGIV